MDMAQGKGVFSEVGFQFHAMMKKLGLDPAAVRHFFIKVS